MHILFRSSLLPMALAFSLAACTPTPAAVPTAASSVAAPTAAEAVPTRSPTMRPAATTSPTVPPAADIISEPDAALFLDVDWYREQQIAAADRWNGGLDGSDGMGAYLPDFNGFFHVNLARDWQRTPLEFSTSVAQSRAIYMNAEAVRAAGPEQGSRFLDAVNKGVEALLRDFRDEELGGYFWEVTPQGKVHNGEKHGYGNVHPIFALAHAYAVTGNNEHIEAAREQLAVYEQYFLDPAFPGAVRPGFSRDFSEVVGVNNIDPFTHYFEALLAMYDVTKGQEREQIAASIRTAGEFLVSTLYVDQKGFDDRGYVAFFYDSEWQPSQIPFSDQTRWSGAQHATPGHGVELAYLLSRAVERGFDEAWLSTAEKLLRFATEYALDPTFGAMQYEIIGYDGTPIPNNSDNQYFIWWPQAETARAMLHLAVVRGWNTELGFKRVESFFHTYQTDQTYGGLFSRLKLDASGTPMPDGTDKGNIWKVNYHFSMLFAEALRLAEAYPKRIAELNINSGAQNSGSNRG